MAIESNPDNQENQFDFIAGELCLDFCNSDETLGGPAHWSYEELLVWSRQAGSLSAHDAAALGELARQNAAAAGRIARRSLKLRKGLLRLFYSIVHGDPAAREDLTAINDEVTDTMSRTRLQYTELGYELDCCGDPMQLSQPLWPIVRSSVNLLTSGDFDRLHACGGDDCEYLFLDATRNRSRQWCDTKVCGNLARVRRHREKIKEFGLHGGA